MSLHQSFSGSSRRPRQVNLSGRKTVNPFADVSSSASPSNQGALAAAQQARELRQKEKLSESATKVIQRYWRGFAARRTAQTQWRHEFDQIEGNCADTQPYKNEREALSQLRLLTRITENGPRDLKRTERSLSRLTASFNQGDHFASSSSWLLTLLRLQKFILNFIDAKHGIPNVVLLQGLALTVSKIPELSAKNARLLYGKLRLILSTNISSKSGRADLPDELLHQLCQIIVAPLTPVTPETKNAYEAFACEILTLRILQAPPYFQKLIQPIGNLINHKFLAHSLVPTLKSVDNNGYIKELQDDKNRACLLGFLISFQQQSLSQSASISYSANEDYIFVISDLMSSVAAAFDSDDQYEDPFVFHQILSLINSDSLTDLVSNTTATRGTPLFDEEAKHVASFALSLLRHFPRKSEDIRIRLYMASAKVDGFSSERLPALKFFWETAKSSNLIKIITQNADAAVPLLKANVDISEIRTQVHVPPYTSSTCQDEWRAILLFLELYSFALKIMDDEEFFSSASIRKSNQALNWASQNSLPLEDVSQLVDFLKNLGYTLYFHAAKLEAETQPRDSGSIGSYFGFSPSPGRSQQSSRSKHMEPMVANMSGIGIDYAKDLVTGVLRMLYERDSRRAFLPKDSWLMLSHFDMDHFITSVVEEEEKRHVIQEQEDEDDNSQDEEDEESSLIGTGHGARVRTLNRRRRLQQKKARVRHLQAVAPRLAILQNIPFFIPFETRVKIFREFILMDQKKRRGIDDPEFWRMHVMMDAPDEIRKRHARIRRHHVFDDAYHQFMPLNAGLKEPIQITFVDAFDNEEAGIDGGGVTKEFLTSVIQEAFAPKDGLNMFVENEQHLLDPNPTAVDEFKYGLLAEGLDDRSEAFRKRVADLRNRYEFLGRIIGKCLYEGILVDVSFAGFFLLKWALTGGSGHAPKESSYRANLNDLREMDEALYQGLLQLKNYPEDVSDFSLDFTINDVITTDYSTQANKVISRDLKPNGTNIPVTNENRFVYISYVARHRLQIQPFMQTTAFLQGLSTMIQPSWLNMFNQTELQTLVSGTRTSIDITDLRRNTQYGGVYQIGDDGLEHPTMQMFWETLEEMDDSERRAVLKFVTSTPRAPLLGFGSLRPPFSIRDSGGDQTRLPSTSTCVNLLKLPIYRDRRLLKDKLLTAVFSGAGFDLS
jgi:ubiquitin-protein ligase E3 C